VIVTLLRHGSTEWNEQGRMQGRRDIPLSERGQQQVRAWRVPADLSALSAEASAAPVSWVSSPLRRAVATAQILSGETPRTDDALTEMDWGDWEGFTLDELRSRHGEAFLRNEAAGLDFRPPGGESPRDVMLRVRSWLARVGADRQPVVAVTHNGVLRAVLAVATGWDMTCKPPIRLRDNTLHRFVAGADGAVSILRCNLALTP
jgi:probable phosphoglycerate mutase